MSDCASANRIRSSGSRKGKSAGWTATGKPRPALAKRSYDLLLADKGGIQSDTSIHVQFLYDEQVFRFIMRVDGQPVRASALTPYKGGASYTQSHFIGLATRS